MTKRNVELGVIPKRELLAYRVEIKGEIFRQIRREFNRLKDGCNFSQKKLAQRLSLDEGLLSRRLQGEHDMQLESLSDLARGLDCKLHVKLVPLELIPQLTETSVMTVWSEAETTTPLQNIESVATRNQIAFASATVQTHPEETVYGS